MKQRYRASRRFHGELVSRKLFFAVDLTAPLALARKQISIVRNGTTLETKVAEEQAAYEIDQIQQHLLEKYGQEGVANEKLQDKLRAYGRKGKDHRDARKLIEGALIYNRTRSATSAGQRDADQFLEQLGELGKVGPAVTGYGNSAAGRKRAREFLGMKEPEYPTGSEKRSNNPSKKTWQGSAYDGADNPFLLEAPKLSLQAKILKNNPTEARQLIRAAGRKPDLFGL